MAGILLGGCSAGLDRPEVGDTWQIEAVDRSGAFGTITIERGELIPLPPEAAVAGLGSQGILVRISYEPDRPSDAGYGSLDWAARLAGEEAQAIAPRVMGLDSRAEWPVEPFLGTRLPASSDALIGWIVVAVTPAELEQQVLLRYQPLIADAPNGGAEAELKTEIVIHVP